MPGQKPQYKAIAMTKEQFFHTYQQLATSEEQHILLESGRGGKLCIAGIRPQATLFATEDGLQINWRNGQTEVKVGDPLDLLTQFVASREIEGIPELPAFQGGVAGFISYDYVRRYENLPNDTVDDLHTPDIYFYYFDQWAIHDIEAETTYLVTFPESKTDSQELAAIWKKEADRFSASKPVNLLNHPVSTPEQLEVSVTGPQFEKMVRDVQAYIAQNEVLQVNLSVRQSSSLGTTPLKMYESLRNVNPSPYMAFMHTPEFSIASSSPELLLKKRGNELSTRPIGGTRPRGADVAEDTMYEAELIGDEKERGEHIMLVDLEKEDLEKVCAPGTVETNEFMVVEKYSHVMHLVSNVRGTAVEGISNADIVRGVFPGGTITGAPKLRTMEIIEELEPTRRGLYTGSIGWFGFNGDFELNVVIRTAFIRDGMAYIQAGAGLVADSIPAAEYVESINKGKALWKAKALAEAER